MSNSCQRRWSVPPELLRFTQFGFESWMFLPHSTRENATKANGRIATRSVTSTAQATPELEALTGHDRPFACPRGTGVVPALEGARNGFCRQHRRDVRVAVLDDHSQ